MSSSGEICAHCPHKKVSITSTWTQTGSAESIKTTGSQTESLPTHSSKATETDKLTDLRVVTTRLNADVNGSSNAGLFSTDILEEEMPPVPNMQPDVITNAGDTNQTAASESTLSTVASTVTCMQLKIEPTTSTAIVADTPESSLLVFNDNTITTMNEGEATNSPSAQKIGLEYNIQSSSTASRDTSIQNKTSTTNIESWLPLKKRKISYVLNNTDLDTDELPMEEIYYPATPMISLAELEVFHLPMNGQFGPFKTPAKRKMPPPSNIINIIQSCTN